MANNMMQLLSDVPPMLIAAWTAWFIVGGMLAMWYRRASLEAEFAPVQAPRTVARPRPATRPASEAVAPVGSEEFVPQSSSALDEPPVAARDKRAVKPLVVGDPYGDLSTLLDQPAQDTRPAPSYRAPSDSPILNSAGSPIQPPKN
jgi:hypothetical protein